MLPFGLIDDTQESKQIIWAGGHGNLASTRPKAQLQH
jgi:hypothetical protein